MLEHIDGLLVRVETVFSKVMKRLKGQDVRWVSRGDVSLAWVYT